MTRKTSIYIAIGLIAIMGIFATVAYAGPLAKNRDGGKESREGRGLGKIAEKLGITDQQKEQIKSVIGKYRDDFKTQMKGMVESGRVLRDTITADSYNESAIRKASNDVNAYKTELAILAGKAYQDIAKILTPEQLSMIREFKQMRQDHVDEMLDLFSRMPGK
jgi:Spy/CpxP family protein refolding chaperone